jgi:hypothetical protein
LNLLKLRLLLLELNVTVGATEEIVICWSIPVARLLIVIVRVSLYIRLNEPWSIRFQCASIIIVVILLLRLHLLIQYVSVDMRWECLLKVLVILEVITGKVFVIICVIEEVPVAVVELQRIARCIVLSIAIVMV